LEVHKSVFRHIVLRSKYDLWKSPSGRSLGEIDFGGKEHHGRSWSSDPRRVCNERKHGRRRKYIQGHAHSDGLCRGRD
jgi:hypothetical protein